MNAAKKNVEELLSCGHSVEIYPQGYSMYPLVRPGRDRVVLEPFVRQRDKIRRGDVLLFRRRNSILVLHRVYSVKPDGVYFVGDNQVEIEGPISNHMILGKSVAFIRENRRISVHHPLYVFFTRLWMLLRPFRPIISKVIHNGKLLLGRGKNEN